MATTRMSVGRRIFIILNTGFLLGLSFVCLAPLVHVLFASISDPIRLDFYQGLLLRPLGFTLQGYRLVFRNPNIAGGYMNTLFYVAVGTTLNMILTSLGAYVLSRRFLVLRNTIMFFIVFTMFFNGGIIPFYLVVKGIGLANTRMALVIPTAVQAFNLIIMRTAFQGVPQSLEDSAKMDGAGPVWILWHVFIPLSQAAVAVITLFYAVFHWNAWFHALIFLRKRELFPIQLILREILIMSDTSDMTTLAGSGMEFLDLNLYKELVKYGTVVVATVPILLLYPFLQRYFVKGVMIGAIKG